VELIRQPLSVALATICALMTIVGSGATNKAFGFNAESMKCHKRPRFVGALERNNALSSSLIIGKGILKSPEDLAVNAEGVIFAGSWKSGAIYRIEIAPDESQKIEVFADTGGGNLGVQFDKAGNLIVCNSPRGLLSIDPKGEITVLVDHVDDLKIILPDDLDIDTSGKIYFTNASNKYDGHEGRRAMDYDYLEARGNGALIVYDPATGKSNILLKGLHFANGVVLSEDESYLLVSETTLLRIIKYWLKGPKAGSSEVFMENLIGFPDGLARDGHGGYYVAFAALRSRYIDLMHRFALVRDLASYGPVWVWEKKPKYGLVIDVDSYGKILSSLQDPSRKVFNVTNVVPWKNYLFLGTVDGNSIGRYDMNSGAASIAHPSY
jgi:sugar lactone lactonase YvrE